MGKALAVFLLVISATYSEGSSFIEENLYSVLMSGLNTEIMPRCNHTDSVTVTLDVALREIVALTERDQTLKLKMWLRQQWRDCNMTWSPVEHGGLTSISVSSGRVWIPDITLYESATEGDDMPGRSFYRINIYSDGTVYFNFPTLVMVSCSVDVTYFPYDTQHCDLKLGSWTYNGLEVDVVPKRPTGDLTSYIKSNEWDVISFRSERHVLYYGCCPEPFPDVTFTVEMKRKPKFYVLTIIFPCTLVLALAALGFILPADSGEKVSLEVTVLLSLSVFLLLVSDKLPASAETFPIIGIYFSVCMVIVCLSCVFAVWVLFLHFRGDSRPVPSWAKHLFLKKLRFVLCDTSRVDNLEQEATSVDDKKTKVIDVREKDGLTLSTEENDHNHRPSTNQSSSPDCQLEEWRAIARVLDRLFFIFYMIISPVVTMIFFGILVDQ